MAESFWESLKRECLRGRAFATRAEARRAIFKWINWYDTTRLHRTLDHAGEPCWRGVGSFAEGHAGPVVHADTVAGLFEHAAATWLCAGAAEVDVPAVASLSVPYRAG